MQKNPFKWPLSAICGVLVIGLEMIFIGAAILLWPATSEPFSIFTNYHSDLGNSMPGYNSFLGASYYNAAQAIQGTLIIMFFGGLYVLSQEDDHRNRKLLLGQIFGIITGIGWLMNGVYPEELLLMHLLWALIFFIAFIPAMILISKEIIKNPDYNNSIGYYGLIAAIIGILFPFLILAVVITNDVLLPFMLFMEFAMIWSSEVWVLLVAVNVLKVED